MNTENKNQKFSLNSENVANNIAWKLNALCRFFDTTYDVNCGGCCYLTYCLAKLLDYDGIPYQVVVVSDDCDDLEDCETLSDIPCSCSHYGICIHDLYINIESYDLDSCYVKYFTNVDPDEILEHYENGDWNNCYNTSKNELIWETLKTFYYDFTENL